MGIRASWLPKLLARGVTPDAEADAHQPGYPPDYHVLHQSLYDRHNGTDGLPQILAEYQVKWHVIHPDCYVFPLNLHTDSVTVLSCLVLSLNLENLLSPALIYHSMNHFMFLSLTFCTTRLFESLFTVSTLVWFSLVWILSGLVLLLDREKLLSQCTHYGYGFFFSMTINPFMCKSCDLTERISCHSVNIGMVSL